MILQLFTPITQKRKLEGTYTFQEDSNQPAKHNRIRKKSTTNNIKKKKQINKQNPDHKFRTCEKKSEQRA